METSAYDDASELTSITYTEGQTSLGDLAGPIDEGEMAERAQALIPDRYGLHDATL